MEIEYIIKEDGSAAITKISDPESILQIPEVLDGHRVTELCGDFIPSSVKTFGTCAFGYMYEHGRAYKLNYFTLLCEEDSPAKKFAAENGLRFQISPKGV